MQDMRRATCIPMKKILTWIMAAAYRGKCWALPNGLKHDTKVTSLSDARYRSLNLEGCDLSCIPVAVARFML